MSNQPEPLTESQPSDSESDDDYKSKLRRRSSDKNMNDDNYSVNLEGDKNRKWCDNDVVWAKFDDFPWWPAIIISNETNNNTNNNNNKHRRYRRKPRSILCQWFGEGFESETNRCKLENVVPWDPEDMDRIFIDVNEEDVSSFEDSCEDANNAYLELCQKKEEEPLKSALIYQEKTEKSKINNKTPSKRKYKRHIKEINDDEYNPDEEQNETINPRRRRRPPSPTVTNHDEMMDNKRIMGPPPLETTIYTANNASKEENDEEIEVLEPPRKRARLNKEETEEDDDYKEDKDDVFNGNDPLKMKVKELKDLCRMKGLKVGGNKRTLIKRLLNPDVADSKRNGGYTVKRVHEMLSNAGINDAGRVSNCLKRGIQRGYYNIDDIDSEIYRGECLCCNKPHIVRMRDCLYQQDYGGNDYEEGGEGGAIKCEDCMGIYVTGLCEGNPSFDSGKFHNHCCECPGFGKCIGDYREAHCGRCGKHYWAGFMGDGTCDNCSRRQRGERFGGFTWFRDDDDEDDCLIQ